ncbi:MAG: DUF2752 domain-containing protein [Clostridia bacterium]|nr:DUF2752 domain-containing protein [Clostridia bacterium]
MNKKKLYFLIITVLIIAVGALLYFFPIKYSCPFKSLFGVYCSGCGVIRAARYILNFQIEKAFFCNQFFVLSLPLYLYFYVGCAVKIFADISILPQKKHIKIFLIVYFSLLLLYGILRNIEIFSFLAPLQC